MIQIGDYRCIIRVAFLQLVLMWVLAAQGGNLVPPKFTSGGSYPMLNSIDVRPSVIQIWDYLCSAKVRLLTVI